MMNNFEPGFLLLDKKEGISSAKALYPIKKLLAKGVKVGHAGTLDPFASGLLVVGVGREATRQLSKIVGMEKVYEFTVQWGVATSTDDLTGEITATSSIIPTIYDIEKTIPNFIGLIEQVPPFFSAINLQGKRAYDLARNNIDFKLESRQVRIDNLELVDHSNNSSSFIMQTGKGCYVRSVARDFAIFLGSFGHVIQLRRLRIGQFSVDKAPEIIENLDSLIRLSELLDL
jgi:tRNA pseudouridine55 synthase